MMDAVRVGFEECRIEEDELGVDLVRDSIVGWFELSNWIVGRVRDGEDSRCWQNSAH